MQRSASRCLGCAGDLVSISSKATSGDNSKFGASVKRLVIGAVPDRGGRSTPGAAAAANSGKANKFQHRKRARGP